MEINEVVCLDAPDFDPALDMFDHSYFAHGATESSDLDGGPQSGAKSGGPLSGAVSGGPRSGASGGGPQSGASNGGSQSEAKGGPGDHPRVAEPRRESSETVPSVIGFSDGGVSETGSLSEGECVEPKLKRRRRESSSESDDSECSGRHHRTRPSSSRNAQVESWRFDPLGSESDKTWRLSEGQETFVGKYFTEYVGAGAIKRSILEDAPCPEHEALKPRKLDTDIVELLPVPARKPTAIVDNSFRCVQTRLTETMGPLGKVWSTLEKAVRKGGELCDAKQLLKQVEQTVLMIGQTNVLLNYNRRLNVMSRFLRDPKRASEIIRQNEGVLNRSQAHLFGSSFYRALHKRAKGNKLAKEIKQELAPSNFGFHSVDRHREAARGNRRPFRRGPSFTLPERRGEFAPSRTQPAAARGRPGHRGGRGRARYVWFSCDNVTSSVRASSGGRCTSLTTSTTAKKDGVEDRSGRCTSSATATGIDSCGGSSEDRRKTPVLWQKLGSDHPGSVDQTGSAGLRAGLAGRTSAEGTVQSEFLEGGEKQDFHGSTDHAGKRGDRDDSSRYRPVCRTHFPTTQKEWNIQAGVQLEAVECVCPVRAFQDGRNADVDVADSEGRLDVYDRPEGCILLRSNGTETSEVPSILLERLVVPVSLPAVWPGISTKSFHEAPQTSDHGITSPGDKAHYLFGRHNYHEPRERKLGQGQGLNPVAAPESGVCHKLGEVVVDNLPDGRIPGVHGGFEVHDTGIAGREGVENPKRLQGDVRAELSLGQATGPADRQIDSLNTGCVSGPIALPSATDATVERPVGRLPELRYNSKTVRRQQGGDQMVDPLPAPMERESDHDAGSRPDYNNGCLEDRMGCSVQWNDHTRRLEPDGKHAAYKCTRVDGGMVCNKMLYEEHEGRACAPKSGQQSHDGPNQQNGWASVGTVIANNSGPVGLLSVTRDHSYCGASSGDTERCSGLPVQGLLRPEQLEIVEYDGNAHRGCVGDGGHRLVCRPSQYSETEVHELEAGSKCDGDGCVHGKLEAPGGICIPAILPDRSLLGKGQERPSGEATLILIAPVWQGQPWFPTVLNMSIEEPILLPPERDILLSPQGTPHPLTQTGSLTLAAWKVSGIASRQKDFLRRLPLCSWEQDGRGRQLLTQAPGTSGVAGVVQNKLIHFKPLWDR